MGSAFLRGLLLSKETQKNTDVFAPPVATTASVLYARLPPCGVSSPGKMMNVEAAPIDTFYASKFPALEEFDHFVLYTLRARCPHLPTQNWWIELGANNHAHLKRMFESRLDPTVVHDAGKAIDDRGGKEAMLANFYMYQHFVGERLKDLGITGDDWFELHEDHALYVAKLWDGIGTWVF